MTRRVVVPSWSRLAPELEVETGCTHAAFVPLGGRPLFQHVINLHAPVSAPAEIVVVVPPTIAQARRDDLAVAGVTTVALEQSSSIGASVLAGLDGLDAGCALAVHMADTLVGLDGPIEDDSVYTQARSDLYRWTTVASGNDGEIVVTHDRDNLDLVTEPQQVCVGLFTFSDGALLRSLLAPHVAQPRGAHDPFFLALHDYSRQRRMALRETRTWFDCGHVDTYYESRLGYQNLRHFNSLTYEPLHGVVTKTSKRREQFRHQVRWYKQVPDSLSSMLPRIFESSDGDEPFVRMELLSIPTLSELFVNERMSPGAWNGVVAAIAHIHEELGRYSYRSTLAPTLAASVYIDKTRERLTDYLAQDDRAAVYKVTVDGQAWTITRVLAGLDAFVADNGLLSIETLSPIHGDFCFSNLLYDPRSRLVKMIDPRGEFGVPGIYGDARYDLAKLAHSFDGAYDFIVSDRFGITTADDGELRLTLRTSAYHERIRRIFDSALLADRRLRREVGALQALLFLSMLPLHADSPQRQRAMLATGLRQFAALATVTRENPT